MQAATSLTQPTDKEFHQSKNSIAKHKFSNTN